jgi:hypothetical protein
MKGSSHALLSRFFLEAVANMSGLRSIRLQDVYLVGTAAEELVKYTKNHRIPLQNFENHIIRESSLGEVLKTRCTSFPGLTSLIWNVWDPESDREECTSIISLTRLDTESLVQYPVQLWDSSKLHARPCNP